MVFCSKSRIRLPFFHIHIRSVCPQILQVVFPCVFRFFVDPQKKMEGLNQFLKVPVQVPWFPSNHPQTDADEKRMASVGHPHFLRTH